MPDVPVAGWVLRAPVPDAIFTLSIEAGDPAAAAEHAVFAGVIGCHLSVRPQGTPAVLAGGR